MKNLIAEVIRSSRQFGATIGRATVRRRDLTARGEEKLQDFQTTSNMAEQLQVLEQHVARASVIDFQQRQLIRNAIATGNYVIDPASIAEKFLKFEKEIYS